MDQIYLPKNRVGFNIGSYVKITPLEGINKTEKPFFYNIKEIEPIKLEIINKIFTILNKILKIDNIIITGSFIEKGFNFKDIDVIIITEEKIEESVIKAKIEKELAIDVHVVIFNKESFLKALKINPIWRIMINKSVSSKRLSPLPKEEIDYRYLDAQAIKSELLIINFDYSTGKEKYKSLRNITAIALFIKSKYLSKESIDREIEKTFNLKVEDIKNNLVDRVFLKKYKKFYKKLMDGIIKNAAKQEKSD